MDRAGKDTLSWLEQAQKYERALQIQIVLSIFVHVACMSWTAAAMNKS